MARCLKYLSLNLVMNTNSHISWPTYWIMVDGSKPVLLVLSIKQRGYGHSPFNQTCDWRESRLLMLYIKHVPESRLRTQSLIVRCSRLATPSIQHLATLGRVNLYVGVFNIIFILH